MPSAAASLEDLKRAHQELQALEMKFPDAYQDFADLFSRNRSLGYKNLCLMLMGKTTPEQLKGLDTDGE